MKKGNIRVFESLTKRKQRFLVVTPFKTEREYFELQKYAKKFFSCGANHLIIRTGFIYKSKLYFEQPAKSGYKRVNVAYYTRKAAV